MQKRGQLAIFVIIAIIIVAGVVIYLLIGRNSVKTGAISPEIVPIDNFVKDCIKKTAIDGIYVLGQNGGMYNSTFLTNEGEIYAYVLNNRSNIPSITSVESQISLYVNENINDCIGNFSNFSSFAISEGRIMAKVKLYNESLSASLSMPLAITKGSSTWKLESFEKSDIQSSFGLMHSIANSIASDYINYSGFSLTYMSEVYDNYNITVNLQHYPDYTFVTLRDEKGVENKDPIEFVFAVK